MIKHCLVGLGLLLLFSLPAWSEDCVHCGKTHISVNFGGTNVETVNTEIKQISHWWAKNRGEGFVLSQDDSFAMCNMVAHPLSKAQDRKDLFNKMVDFYLKKYGADNFLDIYKSIRCSPGISLLSTAVTYGNFEAALEMYKKRIPLNTVNELGQTELDYLVEKIKEIKGGRIGNLMWFRQFFKSFRGSVKNYDIPLLTCEIEKTCTCPFSLPNYGAECTPPQT